MTTPASTTSNAAAAPGTLSGDAAAQLRRLRWAVRATLTLGVAASVAANVLHARPNPISQVIAAWPPLALLLTVELISRVPHHRRALGIIRIAATALIAGIATWVSYWHLVGVAARYGETEAAAAYLLPLSVDGLVVVASVSLVEITGRLRAASAPPITGEPAPSVAGRPRPDDPIRVVPTAAAAAPPVADPAARPSSTAPTSEPAEEPQPVVSPAAPLPRVPAAPSASMIVQGPPAGDSERVVGDERPEPVPVDRRATGEGGDRPVGGQVGADRRTDAEPNTQDPHPAAVPATGPAGHTPSPRLRGDPADRRHPHGGAGGDEEVVPSDTAGAVSYWHRRDPDLHPAQIAARIGRSERTVRRHLSAYGSTSTARYS
ncbi:DUF2637 domain-containing protein [Micromonospora peucetia]|uniref:DUF2637 domain-containing protein n=1 Tax=Micromonospora peucetia TaxID=47871 RepID=UPI002255B2A1|nr:DUF2637 domain-containing protein [Micromonospora peucetia]MCX4387294.1 DUF2637 domain-containing protein [Micromonospora peucetia]